MRDLAIGAAVAAGVALYLLLLPQHLGESDESYFLYHAKRVFDGQIPHRDFYELHMTLPYYAMAALFRVFGLNMTTAAAASAAVQSLLAWGIYATARTLGAGRGLALVAAVAQAALLSLAWPYGSPHWIATLVLLVLMRSVCRVAERGIGYWFGIGLLVGVLGVTQHQNAALVAIALLGLLLLDDWLTAAPAAVAALGPTRGRRLGAYVAGCALIPVPYLLVHMALAGWWNVVDQVILYPLQGYSAQVLPPAWGSSNPLIARYAHYTFVGLVKWTPALLPLVAAQAVAARRRGDGARAWRLVAALVLAGTASVSMLYNPDFIHLAFMAPLYLPLAAELAETAIDVVARRLPDSARVRLAPVATAVLLALLGVQLARNAGRFRTEYARAIDTPFGRVAVHTPWLGAQLEATLAVVRARGTTELFTYPIFPFLFLTTGTDNPSRHDILMERLSAPEHYQETMDVLDAHPRTLVHVTPSLVARKTDRFLAWLAERGYRCVEPGHPAETPPGRACHLYARADVAS